jgi:hypothetical protein
MAASVVELILARVAAVLLAGSTAAGSRVYRARDDAFADDELPAIVIRRGATDGEVIGEAGERVRLEFTLAFHVAGSETAADALHVAAHALLLADATLASRGRGLRCLGTEIQTDAADQPVAKLTARYQMQVFIRPGDLTRAIN